MRVPPPGLLKLDRKALLRDVRDRIAERLPRYAKGPDDPTDPGWLLLEQSAWLTELLSEQLDRYPFAVVQQLLHHLGGHLRPAQPALGALVLHVGREGRMVADPAFPNAWRFFTPQGERTDTIEFVPAENEVSLLKGSIASVAAVRAGELFRGGKRQEDKGLGAQIAWTGAPVRSKAFDREQIRYTAMTNNAAVLLKAFQDAIQRVGDRRIGWLRLTAAQVAKEQVAMTAEIDLAGVFERTAPGGVWTGGDLEGDWGALDDSTWSPPVVVADLPLLPARLRGSRPMPAAEEGKILLPDVPADSPTAQLLVRRASPMPASAVEAIWKTVASQDTRLLSLRPQVQRLFRPEVLKDPDEPAWLGGALERGLWSRFALGGGPRTVAHLRFASLRDTAEVARVAVVLADADAERLPKIEAWGLDGAGVPSQQPLKVKLAWALPSPSPRVSRGMALCVALDLPLAAEHTGALVAVDGEPVGFLLNAILVANAPAVRDGRKTTILRNVPESASLLFEDAVSPSVVEQLLEQPIPPTAATVLRQMPLANFTVEDQAPIRSWAGIQVDPTEGKITFNAPDDSGLIRTFRPGARIRLDWYRRTDGEAGNVGPGAITLVEQEPEITPSISRVVNPLGCAFGADRESPEAAIDRMAAPTGGMPVLPTDFERLVRQALGNRGQGWMVRCWSYAERALLTTALWPPETELSEISEAETARLREDLEAAGPDQLLVVLGPAEGGMTEDELVWARQVVRKQIRTLSQRLPTVRDAVVTRFWPLSLRNASEVDGVPKPVLPAFDPASMPGELVDERGRTAVPPRVELLLNAAVTRIGEGAREAP